LFAAVVVAVLAATPAHADPTGGILTGLVFSALASNSITFALAGSAFAINAISAAVTAGLYLGAQAAFSQRSVRSPDDAKETYRLSDGPALVLLGRGLAESHLFFGGTRKAGPYRDLYRAGAYFKGPVADEDIFVDGRPVVVDADGAVASPPFARVTGGFGGGAFGGALEPPEDRSWMRILLRAGLDPETHFSELVTAFPDLWSENHRGDEVATALYIARSPGVADFLKIWKNGKPKVGRQSRYLGVYDPRTETTGFSDNGVLCVLHHLTLPAAYGWGYDPARFDMEDIGEQATLADAPMMNRAGGFEPRSRCWGVYSTDTPRETVLADLLLSTGTEIVTLPNGKYSIRLVNDHFSYTEAGPHTDLVDYLIREDDILEFDWARSEPAVSRPNRCVGRYYSAEQNFTMTEMKLQSWGGEGGAYDGAPWSIDHESIARTGERIAEFNLNFCPSNAQAARILRRLFATRRAPRGTVRTNLYGFGAFGRPRGGIAFPDQDETVACQLVAPRFEKDRVSLTLPFVELPALAAFDPDVDEPLPPDELPDASHSGDVDPPELTGALVVAGVDSAVELRLGVTLPVGVTQFEANYRGYEGGADGEPLPYLTMTENATIAWTEGGVDGNRYDFRARSLLDEEISKFVNLPENRQGMIATYDNTPCGAPALSDAFYDPGGPVFTFDIDVTELRAARVVVERRLSPSGTWFEQGDPIPVRPGQTFAFTDTDFSTEDLPLDYRARTLTSDGTPGDWSSVITNTGS
jgi:hypothetical protein